MVQVSSMRVELQFSAAFPGLFSVDFSVLSAFLIFCLNYLSMVSGGDTVPPASFQGISNLQIPQPCKSPEHWANPWLWPWERTTVLSLSAAQWGWLSEGHHLWLLDGKSEATEGGECQPHQAVLLPGKLCSWPSRAWWQLWRPQTGPNSFIHFYTWSHVTSFL